jgi:cell wall-associated NlpC family hydrolase
MMAQGQTTRQRLVDVAMALVGTPFHHAQRCGGPRGGCDCSGMLILAARACGISVVDDTTYGRDIPPAKLRAGLKANCDEIPVADAGPGDVLAFFYSKRGKEQHLGMITKPGWIVHAHERRTGGCVREESLGWWEDRIVSAWRLRGAG